MPVESFPLEKTGYSEAEYFRRKNLIQRQLMALSGNPMEWVAENAFYFNSLIENDESVLKYADKELTGTEAGEIMGRLEEFKLRKAA